MTIVRPLLLLWRSLKPPPPTDHSALVKDVEKPVVVGGDGSEPLTEKDARALLSDSTHTLNEVASRVCERIADIASVVDGTKRD